MYMHIRFAVETFVLCTFFLTTYLILYAMHVSINIEFSEKQFCLLYKTFDGKKKKLSGIHWFWNRLAHFSI